MLRQFWAAHTSGYQPHPNQQLVHESPARFRVLVAGRRFGKTKLLAAECIARAIREGHDEWVCWWVAPTYLIADKGWREIQGYLPKGAAKILKQERTFEFRNGARVSIKTADNPEMLVGEGLALAILDEAARIDEIAWEQSIAPSLIDRQGSAVFATTPLGMNWVYRYFRKGELHEDGYASFHFGTKDNPHIPVEEILRLQKDLPDRVFRQEVLAEFVEGAGSVFIGWEDCTLGKSWDGKPGEENTTIGVDLGKSDATVISVFSIDRQRLVHQESYVQMPYSRQLEAIADAVKKWRPRRCLIEINHQGDPIIEQLQYRLGPVIEPFNTRESSKKMIIESLSLSIQRRKITFPAIHDLTEELRSFQYHLKPNGAVVYGAPKGMHDDRVMSMALAHHAAVAMFGVIDRMTSQQTSTAWLPTQRKSSIAERPAWGKRPPRVKAFK